MCPPGCYHNGFMATPELGHRMYGYIYWVESLVRGVHYWHICFAHCSQFEHSCDSTMQSNNV